MTKNLLLQKKNFCLNSNESKDEEKAASLTRRIEETKEAALKLKDELRLQQCHLEEARCMSEELHAYSHALKAKRADIEEHMKHLVSKS